MAELVDIFLNILLPILALIALGTLMRWKFTIDMTTLSKLNIYLFVPGFVFYNVAYSPLDWTQMGGVVMVTVVQVVTLGLLVWGIGKSLGASTKTLGAVALAVMFYNSGNYGLPLSDLAFPREGPAVQAFVILTQNVLLFTFGAMVASVSGAGSFAEGLKATFRVPMIPMLIAGIAARAYLRADPSHELPTVIRVVSKYLSDGLVPVALVTLGAQLAINQRWPRWRPVALTLVLRLILGPVQMAVILWLFHAYGPVSTDLWTGPHRVLILTAGVPTAVNTLLLTMELDGDAALAADCIFWTTVFSVFTIAGWLMLIRILQV